MSAPADDAMADELRRFFAQRAEGIAAAWLFGSRARGTARSDSDVDVAVLFDAAPGPALHAGPLDLEGEIEKLLRRETQVIVMNDAPVDLVHRVLRDGVLLCEHDRRARVGFEVRARNEYFDLLPHLRRYRRHA